MTEVSGRVWEMLKGTEEFGDAMIAAANEFAETESSVVVQLKGTEETLDTGSATEYHVQSARSEQTAAEWAQWAAEHQEFIILMEGKPRDTPTGGGAPSSSAQEQDH